ncbi:TonB-dependent receptor domain-containing protein [Isoalcanivorax beigongshangi]|uniref:TonB-dependent receptor n=1 Tax=Isoalcanivorax beigongshangi TaxID=3238810 RepID=A0ABV4AH69_9GAMM
MRPLFTPRLLCGAIALASSSLALAQTATNTDDVVDLKTVTVISASGFEQHVEDAPASISVITREELEKQSYKDVTDALKNVPGVYVTGGSAYQDVSMRGMSSAYTLYLVDGRPVQGSDAFSPNGMDGGTQVNFLPPLSMIERIEVIRGPMSSLYGSDAMGGIINIITRRSPAEWGGTLSMGYDKPGPANRVNEDGWQTNVYMAGPVIQDLLSLQLTGALQGNDESTFIGGQKSGSSDPEFKRRQLGLRLNLTPDEANDFSFAYDFTRQERTHNLGVSSTVDSYNRGDKDVFTLAHAGRYNNVVTDSYVKYEDSQNPTRGGQYARGIFYNTLIAHTHASYFIDNHTVTAGVEYRKEELEDRVTNYNNLPITLDRWQYAVFAEDEWRLTDRFALTGGMRYNHDEQYGGHVSPRLYAVFHATDQWTLKGGVSTGYKAPSLRESSEDFAGTTGGRNLAAPGAVIKGNPDLEAEKSINYEAGFVFNEPAWGLNLSAMLFHTQFKDKILEDRVCSSTELDPNADQSDPNTWLCDYQGVNYWFVSDRKNVDKAEMQGVEATLAYQVIPDVLVSASYTFTESEQKSGPQKGNPLNKMPRHMFNAGVEWQTTDNFSLWSQVNHRGRTSDYLSRTSMSNGTPGYSFVDVGMNLQLSERLRTRAGVYNIGNRTVTNSDYDVVLDGRRYNIGLTVDF